MRSIEVTKDEKDTKSLAALRALTKDDQLYVVSETATGFAIAATPCASAIIAQAQGPLSQRDLLHVNKLAGLMQQMLVAAATVAEPIVECEAGTPVLDLMFLAGAAAGFMADMMERMGKKPPPVLLGEAHIAGMRAAKEVNRIVAMIDEAGGNCAAEGFVNDSTDAAVVRAMADAAMGKAAKA